LEFETWNLESESEHIIAKLRQFCAYQERSIHDVQEKLREWKVGEKHVEKIIEQLTREDYLNEERFARSFALSSQSGMPLVPALTVVAKTVDNAYIGSRIEQMRDGIERGTSIANCAASVGIFTPVVMQMITVGEETGELDSMLFEIAEMYEREVDHSIKGLSSAIEPILLAVISALMLVLALGIFMPLWNMGQAAMGRGGG